MRVHVRNPQPGDVRALEAAERQCFVDPWPSQFFMAEIFAPGRFNRVTVDSAGDLAAYLFTVWQYLDLHVLKVATLPRHRRHGLARDLLRLAEQHATEMAGESLTLEVRPGNRPAVAMYEALGYVLVGRRPHYYHNHEDALIMTKRVGLDDPSSR